MNLYNFIKTISLLTIFFSCYKLQSTIKTFVNDSSKIFVVKVYDNDNNIIAITLTPGAIQDVFIPGKVIDKIVVQDEKQTRKSFGSMNRQILRKENSKINESMIFVIHQDGSIKMHKGTTQRDETLRKIDAHYEETGKLPTLDMIITNTKNDQLITTQKIDYCIKYGKTILESIGSIFS